MLEGGARWLQVICRANDAVDSGRDGVERSGTEGLWYEIACSDLNGYPAGGRVAAPPGELFAGVAAGVGFDLADGFVKGNEAIKISEKFLIANSLQRRAVTMRQQGADFFQKPLLHHLVNAGVDARIQFLTWPVDNEFLNLEIAFLRLRKLPGRERPASTALPVLLSIFVSNFVNLTAICDV